MPIPDITEKIPAVLSAREVSSSDENRGYLYDVLLSGVGFVLAVSSNTPYKRESSPVQKQQIDTSTEAGEQTLDGMWTRSQTSWHLGAGAEFYEPGSRDEANPSRFRFRDSRGVNVWDQGKLSLHRKVDSVQTSGGTVAVCGARLSTGEDVWYSRIGDEVFRHHTGGITSHGTAAFSLAGGRLEPAGSMILVGGGFGVHKTDLTGATVSMLLTLSVGSGTCQPYWVKGRIITVVGRDIHENAPVAGNLDATSLLFTHPDTGWTWAGVTETPDAILAAGYSGGTSAIYAFVLTDGTTGTAPELTQPAVVAELPPGEEIRCIRSYLGKYLGIGTTAGVRVGVIGQGGQVQYGPLLVETDAPVTTLGARDSFLYAGTGNSVIRVNLSEAVDGQLRFPFAYDVETPAGHTITSLAFDGVTDRVVLGSDSHGTYAASETEYVTTGWLESGGIRYGTTAPKAFRALDLVGTSPGSTSVGVSAVVEDADLPLVTLSQGKSGLGISLATLPVPLATAGYKLTLGGGSTDTPTVDAVSVRAVPVVKKQRLIQYPLEVSDHGRDAKSVAYGRKGYASEQLAALEALEDSQSIITVNDRSRPEQYEATIESVDFSRVQPTARTGEKNFGGIVLVTVRTV